MQKEDEVAAQDAVVVDERPQRTFCRVLALQKFPTLQSIVGENILKNPSVFSSHPDSSGLTLKKMALTVRDDLFKILVSICRDYEDTVVMQPENEDPVIFKKILDALKELITPECDEFVTDWFLAPCPQSEKTARLEQILQILASEAKKLEALTIGDFVDIYSFASKATQFFKNPNLKSCLLKMSTLTELELNKHLLTPGDLVTLGEGLPNLETLQCNLLISPKQKALRNTCVTKMMTKLQKLDDFSFEAWTKNKKDGRIGLSRLERTDLATFCLLNFPRLSVIGGWRMQDSFHELHPSMALPDGCSLTHLCVHALNSPTKEQCLKLTEVKTLLVSYEHGFYKDRKVWNYESLLHLKNVKCLELSSSPPYDHLMAYLKAYTPNLEEIGLDMMFGAQYAIDLQKVVMELCPKLKVFKLNEGCIMPILNSLIRPTQKLEYLSTLRLSANLGLGGILLSGIFLSAPNLKSVYLDGIPFDVDDVMELASLVKDNKVCNELVSFTLLINSDNFVVEEDQFLACCELVKNVCAYAPKLREVEFKTALSAELRHLGIDLMEGEKDFFAEHDDKVLKTCIKNLAGYAL